MNELYTFLQSQRLLTIASRDEHPWICNVYYGVGKDKNIYFISGLESLHSKQILHNPQVAFSTTWYSTDDYTNRKSIQGKGICRVANSETEIKTGIELHNNYFPEFAERITVEWILDQQNKSTVWIIEPSYIKFWNDELYGINGTKEFTL